AGAAGNGCNPRRRRWRPPQSADGRCYRIPWPVSAGFALEWLSPCFTFAFYIFFRPDMAFAATPGWISGSSLLIYRVLTWAVLAMGLLFGAAVLVLRYWILPDISSHRETIARVLSEATQQQIAIGGISADWNGLRPQLALSQVVVHDSAG